MRNAVCDLGGMPADLQKFCESSFNYLTVRLFLVCRLFLRGGCFSALGSFGCKCSLRSFLFSSCLFQVNAFYVDDPKAALKGRQADVLHSAPCSTAFSFAIASAKWCLIASVHVPGEHGHQWA
jgi:hypothetical protein